MARRARKSSKKPDPQTVILGDDEFEECAEFARKLFAMYKGSRDPHRVDVYHTVDDAIAARCAELAVCKTLRLNASEQLSSELNKSPGDGWFDLTINTTSGPKTIDVKSTDHPRGDKLIWPKTKNDFFIDKAADILVFCHVKKGGRIVQNFRYCMKDFFRRKRKVSAGREVDGLDEGTRYMYAKDMSPIHHLIDWQRKCVECGDPDAPFGTPKGPMCELHVSAYIDNWTSHLK